MNFFSNIPHLEKGFQTNPETIKFQHLHRYPVLEFSTFSLNSVSPLMRILKEKNWKLSYRLHGFKSLKMSRCLSHLPISNLIMSDRATSPRLIHLGSPVSRRTRSTSIRAVASSEGRDNVNHLQRPNKHQAAAQQPRRRLAPVSGPVGMWDRFPTARTVQQMMETMDRLMEDDRFAYSGGGVWWPSAQTTEESKGSGRGRKPWEIKESEEDYKMRFDMPGMNKNDVKVWIEDQMLVVRAEKIPKNKDDEEEEEGWGANSYGRYSNRIALPENVEFEKIRAEVKDGVLYISIPKASPRTKVLDINVE